MSVKLEILFDGPAPVSIAEHHPGRLPKAETTNSTPDPWAHIAGDRGYVDNLWSGKYERRKTVRF